MSGDYVTKEFGSAAAILIHLLDGKMKASDVQKFTAYDTGLKKLNIMLGEKLVSVEIEDTWRKTNWYSLTDKGRRVAEHLKAAQEIIDGE